MILNETNLLRMGIDPARRCPKTAGRQLPGNPKAPRGKSTMQPRIPVRPLVVSEPVGAGPARQPAKAVDFTGCPWHDVKSMLRDVGLRPTRQRMSLGWILFAKGDRHLTAEMLYEEANKAKVPVSLATVYNTLHQFTEVGLLRQIAVDGSKTYFDTNVSDHHHFYVEDANELVDIPVSEVAVDKMPEAPEGYEIARIDVVVRLKPVRG
jgi:Fur family transcriptional regulator, iron response regulator